MSRKSPTYRGEKRFSSSGQPKTGAVFTIRNDDGTIKEVTLVGKAYGKGGNSDLVAVVFEYPDGERTGFLRWPDVRSILDPARKADPQDG